MSREISTKRGAKPLLDEKDIEEAKEELYLKDINLESLPAKEFSSFLLSTIAKKENKNPHFAEQIRKVPQQATQLSPQTVHKYQQSITPHKIKVNPKNDKRIAEYKVFFYYIHHISRSDLSLSCLEY
jgi:hypothetical protein